MDTEQWAWDGRPHAYVMGREVALCTQNRSHFVIQIVSLRKLLLKAPRLLPHVSAMVNIFPDSPPSTVVRFFLLCQNCPR